MMTHSLMYKEAVVKKAALCKDGSVMTGSVFVKMMCGCFVASQLIIISKLLFCLSLFLQLLSAGE